MKKSSLNRALALAMTFVMVLGLVPASVISTVFAENTSGYAASYEVDLYEPVTDVNTAPIIMQSATSGIYDVSGQAKRPSAIIFDLKVESGVLNAYDGTTNLGTFASLYAANQPKANVGVRIALGDQDTAGALATWATENTVGNLWLISSDVEVLETVTNAVNTIRGIVDLTGTVRGPANTTHNFDKNGDGEISDTEFKSTTAMSYETKTFTGGYSALTWDEVYDLVFTLGYRTVLIPESAATKENIKELQISQVFTIVETSAPTAVEMYDLLLTGANGILTDNYTTGISVLESEAFNAEGGNIVLRDSNVIGHRGDMGNLTVYPENTPQAVVSAAQSGASTVELDVYFTLDGVATVCHGSKTTDYIFRDDAPLTDDEKATLLNTKISARYWKGDMEYLVAKADTSIPMPQLHNILEAIDTEYPDLRLHLEVKNQYATYVNRIINTVNQYGMRSRCTILDNWTLDKNILSHVTAQGVAGEFMNNDTTSATENRVYAFESTYRALNTVWTAGFTVTAENQAFVEELKHFGVVFSPSYANELQLFDSWYVAGIQGGITNYPHNTDDIISTLIPTFNASTGEMSVTARTLAYGKTAAANAAVTVEDWWIDNGVSSGKTEYKLSNFEIVVLDGAENVTVEGTKVLKNKGATSGKATVAVRYLQTLTGGATCYVYSPSIAIEAVVGTPTSQTFRFSAASGITALTEITESNYKTLTYTYSTSDKTLHPHLANSNNNWWYYLGNSSSSISTYHWKPAWGYLRATNSTVNAAYVAVVIDVAEAGNYEMVLDLCNATSYYGGGRMLLLPYDATDAQTIIDDRGNVWLPDGIAGKAVIDVTFDCAADNVTNGVRQALLGSYNFQAGKYILIFLNNGQGAYSTATNTGAAVYALTLTKDDVAGATLQAALNNAATTDETDKTVQIVRDMTVTGHLDIPAGVRLDLRGNDLTVGTVMAGSNDVNYGEIVNSVEGEGGLTTTSGLAPILNSSNEQITLYDASANTYRVVDVEDHQIKADPVTGIKDENNDAFVFKIDLPQTAYGYVADSNVKVTLDITCGDKTVSCVYSEDMVNEWAAANGAKAFFVDIADMDKLSGQTLEFTATLKCGTVENVSTSIYLVP